jgi:hypothetical protein
VTDLLAATKRVKAVSRLLGDADEATAPRYNVRDAFSDEEFFREVKMIRRATGKPYRGPPREAFRCLLERNHKTSRRTTNGRYAKAP